MQRKFSLSDFLETHGYVAIEMQKNVVGHFELDAHINGQPARLLIDTGASRTVIDQASAHDRSLKTTHSEQKGGGIGTSGHSVQLATLQSLEFDGWKIGKLRVAVMDLSHVSDSLISHGGQTIDGVIGGDLMTDRSAIIDYATATIYLLRE
jgi:clan AA aspartic protease (TIGR02281 family)